MSVSRTYGHVLLVLGGAVAIAATCSAAGCGSDPDADPIGGDPDSGSSGTSGQLGGDADNVFDSAFDPDAACASATVTAKRAPANILFIVDRSGSMNCNPPPITTSAACEQAPTTADGTKPTKWSVTKDALKAAIAAMPAADSAGLTYFNVDNDCAVQATPNVPVKPINAQQLQLLGQSLDNVTPEGLTPIVGGVTLGYQHLHTNTFVGRKYLVLLTDGQETCAGDQKAGFLSTTVPNAAAVGIRTFVIGAPGSEPSRGFLSQIAYTGLTARTTTCNHANNPPDVGDCHFDLTGAGLNLATELNAALDAISKEALACEYDVPAADGGTIDYGRVNVVHTPAGGQPQPIPQDASKSCLNADGWQYSADRSRIILCGPACAKVKADTQGGSVSIQLGCQTIIR
jgi:hypothetical protein